MTRDEFRQELRAIPWEWTLTEIGRIRAVKRKRNFLQNILHPEREYCLVTGMCKRMTGRYLSPLSYDYAASGIALPFPDAKAIVAAADKLPDYDPELRRQLLEDVELVELVS